MRHDLSPNSVNGEKCTAGPPKQGARRSGRRYAHATLCRKSTKEFHAAAGYFPSAVFTQTQRKIRPFNDDGHRNLFPSICATLYESVTPEQMDLRYVKIGVLNPRTLHMLLVS